MTNFRENRKQDAYTDLLLGETGESAGGRKGRGRGRGRKGAIEQEVDFLLGSDDDDDDNEEEEEVEVRRTTNAACRIYSLLKV